jgi:hypothetical protein
LNFQVGDLVECCSLKHEFFGKQFKIRIIEDGYAHADICRGAYLIFPLDTDQFRIIQHFSLRWQKVGF